MLDLLMNRHFIRLWVSKAGAEALLKRLEVLYGAKVALSFHHAPADIDVYMVVSDHASYSVAATDREQPVYATKTKIVVTVKSMDKALALARAHGIEIAQDLVPVATGLQSRLKLSDDHYIELTEWTPEHIAAMKAKGFDVG